MIDAARGDYYVPDVVFTCESTGKQNLEAPTAVAEVLSPSTMLVDINEKLARYQQVPSVTEIWLVASRERWVAVYRRGTASGYRLCPRQEPARSTATFSTGW